MEFVKQKSQNDEPNASNREKIGLHMQTIEMFVIGSSQFPHPKFHWTFFQSYLFEILRRNKSQIIIKLRDTWIL